jgi:hypothetical protein
VKTSVSTTGSGRFSTSGEYFLILSPGNPSNGLDNSQLARRSHMSSAY